MHTFMFDLCEMRCMGINMDIRNLIWVSASVLLITIVFTIKRNRFINFILGFLLITFWMAVTITLPFFLLYAFKIEGIYLFFIVFSIFTIYFIRSNFFVVSEFAGKTDDLELINLDKAIRLYVKSLYLTLVNTAIVIILMLAGLGIVSLYPLIVLCSSVWAIPVAILGAIAGALAFGILMIGFVPSIVINVFFTINGVSRLVSALKFERKEKVKHIMFSLIPYWGLHDGIKLIYKAKKDIESRGYKWNILGYKQV